MFRTKKTLKKELEAWKDKAELNARSLEISERNRAELMARLEKIENGERCEGAYCGSCKNAIEGDYIELLTQKNQIITVGDKRIICALSVPCKDFKRKEEKHDGYAS